jgi:DNA polymerase-3 subunit gamma/tau
MAEAEDQQASAPKRPAKKAAKAEGAVAPAAQSHAALARKYRPKLFAELIGQDAMVQTLRNAFASGRIAQAYMLTGVRGVGKTTTARLISRALNYALPGIGGARDQQQRGWIGRSIFLRHDAGEMLGKLLDLDALQVEALAARQHGDRHFPRLGGGEDELHMLRRLFQGLE